MITFTISGSGPFAIAPLTALPDITNTVFIDATTQLGYSGLPKVEIIGTNFGTTNITALYIAASNCTVRGFAIDRFGGYAIAVAPTAGGNNNGNVIQANFIGTGVYGTNALANISGGIYIQTANNLIGGTAATNRNIISGGNTNGIYLRNSSAYGNQILGNYIGTDITGTNRLGNAANGIVLESAVSNSIGGTIAGSRNIISGNGQSGIYIQNLASANIVQGNYIGLDSTGNNSLSNAADGITILQSTGQIIGGTNAAARNIISGNGDRGITINASFANANVIQGNYIGTSASGLAKVPNRSPGVEILNCSSNTIGGAAIGAGNVISGNAASGVAIDTAGAAWNIVQGNFIGTDATGTNALGNAQHGIILSATTGKSVSNNIVTGNVISGNAQNGIYLSPSSNAPANITKNSILGNLIGTDSTGTRRLGNNLSGIRVDAAGNIIGGTIAATRNVVSGNTNNFGIFLSGAGASNNLILGNYIGTDINGASALGNGTPGIGILGSPSNTFGGTVAGAGNVVSANGPVGFAEGIYLYGSGTVSNLFLGNIVGANASGTSALGNSSDGISINELAHYNTIGGTDTGAGNLISANGVSGIYITNSDNTVIQGNSIGTKADGVTAQGNVFHNIEIYTGNNTTIGGTNTGAGNRIAFAQTSQRSGIRVRNGTGHLIAGNSIFSNAFLGIDLETFDVTPNDGCDGDAGANLQQNFPVLTAAFTANNSTCSVRGSLNSTANSTYLLCFYSNTAANSSGHYEGKTFLGSAFVNTGASCTGAFTAVLTATVPVGAFITATASDAANNTSEFSSAAVAAIAAPGLTATNIAAGSQLKLSWPSNSIYAFNLQQTTNLTPAIVWSPVTNVVVFSNGTYSVTIAPLAGGNRFYRLNLP